MRVKAFIFSFFLIGLAAGVHQSALADDDDHGGLRFSFGFLPPPLYYQPAPPPVYYRPPPPPPVYYRQPPPEVYYAPPPPPVYYQPGPTYWGHYHDDDDDD